VGIKEIVYSLHSSLSESFTVKLSRELKGNSVNIIIDEFSGLFDISAIKKTKELFPNTKIVIAATEFTTPVSVFGVELMNTFNFFGSLRDWRTLMVGALLPVFGGMPSYMRLRYLGFVRALQYCDLLTVIHPQIMPTAKKLADQFGAHLGEPLLVYPQIGELSSVQLNRLWNLPVGFTMTGTQTRYRNRIARDLVRKFTRVGWFAPVYKQLAFETTSSASADESVASDSLGGLAEYHSISPDYLFNINPPQTKNWRYSSPMRILRAILLGQIPVVTKKFHDHLLEGVAMQWDGKLETAVELGARQLLDRRLWLIDYMRSLEAYDQQAREANRPFVSAMTALAESAATDALASTTEPKAFAALNRAGERR
jgi:hypothetical protein